METTETLLLRGIPPRLKGKIVRRVEQASSNMNDVLVALLSEHFGIPFTPTGVKRSGTTSSPSVLLQLPAGLKQEIVNEAAANRMTQRNVAMKIICEAFKEPFVPTGRWEKTAPRPRKAAAA